MEGDEMEMSREELQQWIRAEVEKTGLISADLLEKCSVLQSLLERREKQAAKLLKLCESVAACEALVKKQCMSLGWKYRDTDDDSVACDQMPPRSNGPVHSETQGHLPLGASGFIPVIPTLRCSENLNTGHAIKMVSCQNRIPVVSLTRIPESKIIALQPPSLPDTPSENENSSDSGSDKQWEPFNDMNESGFLVAKCNSRPKKRRKMYHGPKEKVSLSPEAHQAASKADAESNSAKIPKPQESTKAVNEATKNPPSVLQEEVIVNMNVLARKTAMSWQRGKIVCIFRKEDGRLKYKVNCKGKGKLLVSGHHIAFDRFANVDLLFVGARVVVDLKEDQHHYYPGIIAELPGRSNRMRFLVFFDDHTPAYVALGVIKLVCRPLKDPLEDIAHAAHRTFMKDYMKHWPYHPQLQYQVGQAFNAEFQGVQQVCKVEEVDCSLMKVVFQKAEHKEWLYKGSMRLEVMKNLREKSDLKKTEELENNRKTSSETSKS